MDPDHSLAAGEVGKVGVSIASLRDMEVLLDGIPLDRVSISMTINGTAAVQKGRFDRSTYILSLTPSVDLGWPCTISPAQLTFADSGTQDFNCTCSQGLALMREMLWAASGMALPYLSHR
jgi:hypothetical protein